MDGLDDVFEGAIKLALIKKGIIEDKDGIHCDTQLHPLEPQKDPKKMKGGKDKDD